MVSVLGELDEMGVVAMTRTAFALAVFFTVATVLCFFLFSAIMSQPEPHSFSFKTVQVTA